jgi:4-hydroxybenzoate polyprenyltransferase
MGRIRDIIALTRPFTLLAPLVGFYCGAIMAWQSALPGAEFPPRVWLGAAGGVLLNIFSNAVNQIYDLEIDRINRPERPLPSGRLKVWHAWVVALACLAEALALGALLSRELLLVFAAAALCTWLYSAPPARFKRHWLPAHAVMAAARGLLIPAAGWAAVAPLSHPDPWAAGAVLFLFVLGAAATKDFADMPGDSANGIKTLPVAFGPARAARMIAPFLVIPFLLIPGFTNAGWLDPATRPLTALALYGAFVAVLMIRGQAAPSRAAWVHMYLLLMLAQAGFAVCYALN